MQQREWLRIMTLSNNGKGSRVAVVSTVSLAYESRGAVRRLHTLIKQFPNQEIDLFVLSFSRRASQTLGNVTIYYLSPTILDALTLFRFFSSWMPLSRLIYQRGRLRHLLVGYDVIVFHLSRSVHLVQSSNSRIIVDICESLSDNFRMRAKLLPWRSLRKWIYLIDAPRIRKWEETLCCDSTLTKLFVSRRDTMAVLAAPVAVLPILLDTANWSWTGPLPSEDAAFDERKIVFLGHVDYEPNLVSVISVIKTSELLSAVDSRLKLVVVGRVNGRNRRNLSRYENIVLTGFVESLSSHMADALCGIALVEHCTGMQSKVIDYFSAGIPALVSPEVAAGYHGGTPALTVRTEEELRAALMKCSNRSWRAEQARQARTFLHRLTCDYTLDIEERYSWSAQDGPAALSVDSVVARGAAWTSIGNRRHK